MGLNQIPSVNIFIRDKSEMPNLIGAGTSVGVIANLERGFEELISVDRKTFYKYFNNINKSFDTKTYAGCVEILKNSSELIIGCVSKNAKYGGVYITDKGIRPFYWGVNSIKGFTFYQTREIIIENAYSGSIDLSKGVVKVGSLKIKYVLNGVENIVSVDENWSVNDSNISNFEFDNNTGNYSITFVTNPSANRFSFIYDSYSDEYRGLLVKVNENIDINYDYSFRISEEIKIDSLYIYYKIGSNNYIAKIINGEVVGDGISDGVIIANGNEYVVKINFEDVIEGDVNISYVRVIRYLSALIAKGNRSWSNKVGFNVVDVDSNDGLIKINEYERYEGDVNYINSYEVKRDIEGLDKYGRNIFIENVFETSLNCVCINNEEYDKSYLPKESNNIVYMEGGVDGDIVTNVEVVNMLKKFYDDKVYFKYFCANGYTDKVVIDEISSLVNEKNKVAYLDVVDSNNVDSIVSWGESNIVDNYRCFFFAPFCYVSVSGNVYYCPISALVVSKQCELVNIGKRFMSPSGVGNGSLNLVKLTNYFNKNDQLKLSKANINAIRYFKEFGAIVFDNQTAQKKFSGTSFINSALTLADMIENFENMLPSLQLNRVIREDLYILVRQQIETYLRTLELEEGTIEPSTSKYGWFIRIDELNNEITIDKKEINIEIVFSFQSVLRTINLYLTYMNNQMIVNYKG